MDDLVGPIRAVCVLDPAIDRGATDLVRYVRERDAALVKELPGQRALWCRMRALTVQDVMVVDSAPSSPHKLRLAFGLAVTAIENWRSQDMLQPAEDFVKRGGRNVPVWSEAEIDVVIARCGIAFVYEIGSFAFQRAIAGNGWSGSAIYTLPQPSVDGLTMIDFRRAAQAESAARASSSAQPSPA